MISGDRVTESESIGRGPGKLLKNKANILILREQGDGSFTIGRDSLFIGGTVR